MNDDRLLKCEQFAEWLDDYLDGGTGIPRAVIEAHLADCPACPALVADVRAIRAAAGALGPLEPPAHVWRGVQARIAADAPRASVFDRLGVPAGWLAAFRPAGAVAGLVLIASSLTWMGGRLASPPPAVALGTPVEFQIAEAEYTDAIARLEEAADSARPRLDAITTATLRSSIDDADLAILDAREALTLEPGDPLTQESLLDALGSKVALLQDTVALAATLEPGTEEQTP